MKKFVVALFAGVLILAIAAPLFAETYIDGQVFYRPRIYWNSDFLKDNKSTNDARILPILWLGAGYKAEDYAEAYFRLYTLGSGFALGGASYGAVGSQDPYHHVELSNAWFDVKIPGTPVHWRVGRQNQSLGHGFYMNTGGYGGDGMKLWAPVGPVRVDAGYFKMNELGDFSHDIDQYFAQISAPLNDKNQVSFAFQWFEGRNLNIANNASSRPGAPFSHIFTVWDPSVTFDSHIWTLGLAADGAVPAGAFTLSYRAEAVYAGGKIVDDVTDEDLAANQDISGYAFLLGGTANFGGMATVTLEGAYGSGDKRKGHIDSDEEFRKYSGSKFEGFRVPMAQWGRSVWFDEWSFFSGSATGDPFDFGGTFGRGVNDDGKRTAAWHQRGLENLIYVTLGGTVTPLPPLTLGIDVFKFWAARTTPKGGFDPDSQILYSKKQDSDLGWEIDLTAKWTMNKNFAVIGAFCPWFPGDYFKVPKDSQYVSDPGHISGFETIDHTSDPSWGYVARANCIFTF
jgi:hypothetical protein